MSKHRTRHRPPRPKSAPVVETDQAQLDLAELAVLWPRLAAALARDTAGPSAEPTGSAAAVGAGSAAVLNLDVQDVQVEIATGVQQIADEVERLLNLGRDWRPCTRRVLKARSARDDGVAWLRDARAALQSVIDASDDPDQDERMYLALSAVDAARAQVDASTAELYRAKVDVPNRWTADVIDAMPDWYAQLRDRGQPLGQHIAKDAERWLRQARTVVRLRTREEPIGWLCPHHRDRPTELRREADEAQLHAALLAGRPAPPGAAPLTWRRAESVYCPRCKERWAGIAELRVLMRMIEQANGGTA